MSSIKPTLTALSFLLLTGLGQAAERSLDKEVIIKATVDQAWHSWTTRDGITAFFAPDAKIEPKVGGAFQIYINPGAEPGAKGADDMRFLALQPGKMISFDWNAPPHLPEARAQRTFVVVRFAPVDAASTRVSIHHTGWGDGGEWDKAYQYFDRAWTNVLAELQKRHDTGQRRDWTEWLASLEKYNQQQRAAAAAAAASAPK